MEDPAQRLRWQAHLEFTHNHDVGDLTWDKIAVSLPRSEKLRSLVLAGIPHGMRPQVRQPWGYPRGLTGAALMASEKTTLLPQLWMRLSGALQKKKSSELSYRDMVRNSSNDETIAAKQVRGTSLGVTLAGPAALSAIEHSSQALKGPGRTAQKVAETPGQLWPVVAVLASSTVALGSDPEEEGLGSAISRV